MHTRRDFLRSAATLTGGAFAWGSVPDAIARALAIDPPAGTTFRDAEHVVVLMQENRSFDHCFGALRGVRGFRDPRAHVLPNGNPVWFQTDAKGDTYAPFRLDISATSATWIGGLPHSWPDQVDARNGGKYDAWLIAKPKRDLPFTLGHYSRADIPFYYALADAFTVCDQAFCSSLTGTTANRLYLWTGTIRDDAADFPRVQNADTDYGREASWRTFPERLEDAGVSWRIYQNEISLDSGLRGDDADWLGSFTDNPVEWFTQYKVRFSKSRRDYLPKFIADAPAQIRSREKALQTPRLASDARARLQRELESLRSDLRAAQSELTTYTEAAWNALPERTRALHEKAFTTNVGDPAYRRLTKLGYQDGTTRREIDVPAGDVLYQFRRDVSSGELPAVSWIVAPANFSDHPSHPWFGAWYVSEVLDILTRNPDVWKKTVFILCYDENDGYFDHVPPFVAPHPTRPETGRVSAGIDTTVDWANAYGRDSSIGLGYRVPLVIASPWSRGGCVNSQVFDHTSVLRFLEVWLGAKGQDVKETNISAWRRLVCGDLTSVFRPYDGEAIDVPSPLDRDTTVEQIYSARFRERPTGGASLSKEAIPRTNIGALQEPGSRPSCPLPYELLVNGDVRGGRLVLTMEARTDSFGSEAQGAPFNAYSYGREMSCRAYAVRAGDMLSDALPVSGPYRVRIDGPNGFMREFMGSSSEDQAIAIVVTPLGGKSPSAAIRIQLENRDDRPAEAIVRDESYGAPARRIALSPRQQVSVDVDASASQGWYDVSVRTENVTWRFAGRVETGKWSITDPGIGRG